MTVENTVGQRIGFHFSRQKTRVADFNEVHCLHPTSERGKKSEIIQIFFFLTG